MTTYQRERLADVRPELTALIAAHWDEVAHHKDIRTLDPDWDQFEAMDAAGNLFFMTARADGLIVGYVAAILRPHLHSKGLKTAYVDAIFLAHSARRNNTGVRLLAMTDTALAAMADFIYWHVKPERDFATLLRRQGCEFIETIWGRATGRRAV